MGNCVPRIYPPLNNNDFIDYINIDKDIVVGIWDNPNPKSSMGNLGIRIGYGRIHELLFAMRIYGTKSVVYNFTNNIRLIIEVDILNDYAYVLKINDMERYNKIEHNNFKKIISDHNEFDMIFDL
jgi:hypothetical protein